MTIEFAISHAVRSRQAKFLAEHHGFPESAGASVVRCYGLRLSSDTLDELDEDRAVVSVPRTDIIRLTLKRGVASERTVLVAVVGLGMIAFAGAVLAGLIRWFFEGGVVQDVHFLMLLAGPIGAWLLYLALRRRFYLLVETESDVRKLAFARDATRDAVETFLHNAHRSLGCTVRNALDT